MKHIVVYNKFNNKNEAVKQRIDYELYFKNLINWKFVSFLQDSFQDLIDIGYDCMVDIIYADERWPEKGFNKIFSTKNGYEINYLKSKEDLDDIMLHNDILYDIKIENKDDDYDKTDELMEKIEKKLEATQKFNIHVSRKKTWLIADDVRYLTFIVYLT